jgi:hypothetical protein
MELNQSMVLELFCRVFNFTKPSFGNVRAAVGPLTQWGQCCQCDCSLRNRAPPRAFAQSAAAEKYVMEVSDEITFAMILRFLLPLFTIAVVVASTAIDAVELCPAHRMQYAPALQPSAP